MLTFPELIKKIREKAGLTQAEFAVAVDVSTVLIAMIESGQKEVSKNFLEKLAKTLDVHPSSITPFLYSSTSHGKNSNIIEKQLVKWGMKMQDLLIEDRALRLRKYASK